MGRPRPRPRPRLKEHDFLLKNQLLQTKNRIQELYEENHHRTDNAINDIKFAEITDLSGLFQGMEHFNAPLNNWGDGRLDVVTNMTFMFWRCEKFNQDLSSWGPHLGQVTDMSFMFWGCREFDGKLEGWNVSQVTNMHGMFDTCWKFQGNGLQMWVLSSVTNMNSMFQRCLKFNQDLSSWGPHLGQVTDMSYMFWECENFNQDLSSWGPHLGQVTDMSYMFIYCYEFDGTLESWNVSKVTDMKFMFNFCRNFSGNGLDTWDWSENPAVSSMTSMFAGCEKFNPSLGNWDQVFKRNNKKLENVERMFYGCQGFKGSGIQCWQLPESLVNNYRSSMSNMLYNTNITTLPWIMPGDQDETFNGNNGNNGIAGHVGNNRYGQRILFTNEETCFLK